MDTLDELLSRRLPVTLRQLQVFLAVCAEGGFTRAGERLRLTQPAVSAQIRQLEQTLGHALVEFVGRSLFLTAEGETLRDAARDVFGRLDALQMDLDALEGRLRGPLRLAVVTSGQYFVPHLLARFVERHPGAEYRVRVTNRIDALDRLASNADDLAIMALPPQDRALERLPFLDNELLFVAPPDHPLVGRPLTLQDLAQTTLLVREPGSGVRRALEEACERAGVQPRRSMELGSSEALREGVRARLGVAMLPRQAVHQDLASGALRMLEVEGFPLRRSWCLVHARGKALPPIAQRLKAFIREHLEALPALLDAQPFPPPSRP